MFHYLRKKRLSSAIAAIFGDYYSALDAMVLRAAPSLTGAGGSFIDSSAISNTFTTAGSPTQVRFGPPVLASSVRLNIGGSTNDSVRAAADARYAVGAGEFAVEAWVYPTTTANGRSTIMSQWTGGGGDWILALNGTQKVELWLMSVSGAAPAKTSTVSVALNAWSHIAVVRLGTTITLYINGVSAFTYTYAGDFGSNKPLYVSAYQAGPSYVFTGYIANACYSKVSKYTAPFTPSIATASADTLLLMNFANPVADNNSITDASGNTLITPVQSPTVGTFAPVAGGYSVRFKPVAAIDYLNIALTSAHAFGTGDFTVEQWVYPVAYGSTISALSDFRGQGSGNFWTEYFTPNGKYNIYIQALSASIYTSTKSVPLNAWTHIAVVRIGTTLKVYFNGVLDNSITNATNWAVPANGQGVIGISNWAGQFNQAYAFQGYISDLRHVKGTGVYTGPFTPPTAPLTAIPGTTLLLDCSKGAIVDASRKTDVMTVGSAKASDAETFSTNYSLSFSGSTTDVVVATPISLVNDFTIDGWFYPTARTAGPQALVAQWQQTTQYSGYLLCVNANGTVSFHFGAVNENGAVITTTQVIPLNDWTHIAVCRAGSVFTLYFNGVAVATYTSAVVGRSLPTINATLGSYYNSSGAFPASGTNVFAGYMDDVRITPNVARYRNDFAVAGTDLDYDCVKVLMHFEGTPGTSTFVDERGTAFTVAGGAVLGAAGSGRFGNTAGQFSSGKYLSAALSLNILTNDFTFEGWAYKTANSGDNSNTILSYGSTGGILFRAERIGGTDALYVAGVNLGQITWPMNQWVHYSLQRKAGAVTLFLDGVAVVTGSAPGSINNSTLYIGGTSTEGFTGRLDEIRFTVGVARYEAGFTVPTAAFTESIVNNNTYVEERAISSPVGDPYYGQVVLHLHMENSHGSTVIADQKGHVFALSGNPYISRKEKRFNTSSLYLNGASRINVASTSLSEFKFARDFTCEGWVNFEAPMANNQYLFDIGANGFYLRWLAGSWGVCTGASTVLISWTNTPATGAWHHWAVTRKNGKLMLFINGVRVGSVDNTAVLGDTTLAIGNYGGAGGTGWVKGHVDEIRFTNGVARYVEDFAVPTAAFPDVQDLTVDPYAKNSILLKASSAAHNNTIIDSSANAVAIARTGNVIQSPVSPYTPNWSTHFVGTGSTRLTIPYNADMNLGISDFTIEAFVTFDSTAGTQLVLAGHPQQSNANWQLTLFNGNFSIWAGSSPSSWNIANEATLIKNVVVGKTYHVAVCRVGNVFTCYVDGLVANTFTSSLGIFNNTGGMAVGGISEGFNFIGSLSNVRVVRGTALYTAEFKVPTSNLTAVSGTVALVCKSNKLSDDSPYNAAITVSGPVVVSTYSPFAPTAPNVEMYGGSLYFDGAGDLLSTAASTNFSLGNTFTIEMWLNPTSMPAAGNQCRVVMIGANATPTALYVGFHSDGAIVIAVPNSGISSVYTAAGAVEPGRWNHFAFSVNAGVAKIFKNGIQVATGALTTQSAGSVDLKVGYDTVGTVNANYHGYVADLRIVKGTALYTGAFTTPASPLTAIAGTQVLLQGKKASVYDASGKVPVETAFVGDTTQMVNKGKYSPALVCMSTGGVRLTDSPMLNAGASDFTIEFWIRLDSAAPASTIFNKRASYTYYHGMFLHKAAGSTGLTFYCSSNGSNWDMFNGAVCGNIQLNVWTHVALIRSGNNFYCAINGVLTLLGTSAAAIHTSTAPVLIGSEADGYPMAAAIEDFRFTKSIARYMSNFTVPVAALPAAK